MHPSMFPWAAFGLLFVVALLYADDMPDLARFDRSPCKEPVYVASRPLYGLAVFGPKADRAVWLVLDKSKRDRTDYDILYIDLKADGDLTAPAKRLTAKEGRFVLTQLTDPATGVIHSDFSLRARGDKPTVMLRLKWRGQYYCGGGYPEEPDPSYMRFAPRPADAPVVWVNGDAPFRFQRWYGRQLPVGNSGDFKVFLGQPGRGFSSFFAATEHILPTGEGVKATLIYQDGQGKEQRLVCELRERC